MARIRKSIQNKTKTHWKVALYIRLSKEDGNDESLSVANQRKILIDYLQISLSDEDYSLIDTYIDDGLTGTDTNRENFMRMKQDIINGRVNCVIVKSLARAFRNLADQQKFLEEFLPLHKARFISLGTPFIDTYVNPSAVSGFEVPIRGMFNEQFAAATSEEIRKTFNMKRSRGEFIGSFAPYGYMKDPDNKNRLMIDEEAAPVIRDIFNWYLYGLGGDNADGSLSINGIARELNERGIASPIQYKRQKGFKYQNPNSRFKQGIWTPTTIAAILKNRMYIGCMVQGRYKVISYKIHKQIKTPEDEWFTKEGTHEAIISAQLFDKVQKRLLRDTRTAPGKKTVHLFSGFLRCSDCGRALHRKSSKGNIYYYCRISKQAQKICMPRSIVGTKLAKAVLAALQIQVSLVEDLGQVIDKINRAPACVNQAARLDASRKKQEQELLRLIGISDSLYTDWKSEVISKDEYLRIKTEYKSRIEQLSTAIEKIQSERQLMSQGINRGSSYFKDFQRRRNIVSLNHEILVDLVDVITVHRDGTVGIEFNFPDPHRRILEFIESKQ